MKFCKSLLSLTLASLSLMSYAQEEATRTTEFEATLQVSQAQFENWSGGGENTLSGRGTLRFKQVYKKDKLTLDYGAQTRYGMNVIEGDAFKNEDEITVNFLSSWTIKESNWAYAGAANFRSQFANGYSSRTDDTLLSGFMAPGYIDLSVGFSYQKPGSPFTLVISPVAGNLTFVLNKELSAQGAYGVDPGKHLLAQLGASIDARFDKKFANDILHYRSRLYTFTSYSTTPTMQWDNTLDIYPVKFLSITLLGKMYYDQYSSCENPNKLQFNYGFTVGLAYLFKK